MFQFSVKWLPCLFYLQIKKYYRGGISPSNMKRNTFSPKYLKTTKTGKENSFLFCDRKSPKHTANKISAFETHGLCKMPDCSLYCIMTKIKTSCCHSHPKLPCFRTNQAHNPIPTLLSENNWSTIICGVLTRRLAFFSALSSPMSRCHWEKLEI